MFKAAAAATAADGVVVSIRVTFKIYAIKYIEGIHFEDVHTKAASNRACMIQFCDCIEH